VERGGGFPHPEHRHPRWTARLIALVLDLDPERRDWRSAAEGACWCACRSPG
jgi:hypothetical protein